MKKFLLICLLMATSFIYYSCEPSEVVVTARPTQPYYVRPYTPGPSYVWVEGDWMARGDRYYWREGYWARPRNRVWISGSWEARPHGWYWRRGYWK